MDYTGLYNRGGGMPYPQKPFGGGSRASGSKPTHDCNCFERDPNTNEIVEGGILIRTACRHRQTCKSCCKNSFGENWDGTPSIGGIASTKSMNMSTEGDFHLPIYNLR